MTTCPTCGRRPSERTGLDWGSTRAPASHAPERIVGPTSVRCFDPLHDLADRCVEIRREALEEAAVAAEKRGSRQSCRYCSADGIGDDIADDIRDLLAKETK